MTGDIIPPNDPRPIAVCPNCGAPLIATFHFAGAEWYCLDCGLACGMFSAVSTAPTPELVARMRSSEAEWMTNAGPRLLTPGAIHAGCHKCFADSEAHLLHASPLERAEHSRAKAWINERRRRHA